MRHLSGVTWAGGGGGSRAWLQTWPSASPFGNKLSDSIIPRDGVNKKALTWPYQEVYLLGRTNTNFHHSAITTVKQSINDYLISCLIFYILILIYDPAQFNRRKMKRLFIDSNKRSPITLWVIYLIAITLLLINDILNLIL